MPKKKKISKPNTKNIFSYPLSPAPFLSARSLDLAPTAEQTLVKKK